MYAYTYAAAFGTEFLNNYDYVDPLGLRRRIALQRRLREEERLRGEPAPCKYSPFESIVR